MSKCMTLIFNPSRSFKVKSDGVNRKPVSPEYNCFLGSNLGGQKLYTFGRFSSSRLNSEYLRNETRNRQSGNDAGSYEGSSTPSRNFVNFGPQTA